MKYLKIIVLTITIFCITSLHNITNVKAVTNQQVTVTASELFELEVRSGGGNGKRKLLTIFVNQNGRTVVVWSCAKNGYKNESSLVINGETYTQSELFEATNHLTIKDDQGNILKDYNDNLYYIAQELHETQKIKDGFAVSITTSAGGHDLNGEVYYISLPETYIQVRHNYTNTSNEDEMDFDFDQTVLHPTVGNTYNFEARESNGFTFYNVVIEYPNGTTQTLKSKNISVAAAEGATSITYNYGIGYSVEYYYDGVIDSTLTEFYNANYGDVINTYNLKPKPGYIFDRVDPSSITISNTNANQAIKVYYVKNPISKSVLTLKQILSGAFDPSTTYNYSVQYMFDENQVTQNFTLNSTDNSEIDIEMDSNSSYTVTITSNIDGEFITYTSTGNGQLNSNNTISGTIGEDNIIDTITIEREDPVLTGVFTNIIMYVLLIVSVIGLVIFIKKKKYYQV